MTLIEAMKILGVSEGLDMTILKGRFRELALKYHPDMNLDEVEAQNFRDIVLAYELLAEHLTRITSSTSATFFNQPRKVNKPLSPLDDVFDEILGFSRSGRILGKGDSQNIVLSLREICQGTRLKRRLLAYLPCTTCQGSGAATVSSPSKLCRYCFGHGEIPSSQGGQSEKRICPRCLGRGREIAKVCETCGGFGRMAQRRIQELKIPVGLVPGRVYALESWDVKLMQSAHVFVSVCMRPHPIFKIENYNLLCEYATDLSRLNVKSNLYVNTPFGMVRLILPDHIADGLWLTIPGWGLFKDLTRGARGDLKVKLIHRGQSWFSRIFGGRN